MYGLYKPRPCQCSLKIKCVTVRGVSEFLLRVPIDRQLLKYPIKQQDKTSKTRPLGPSDYEATSPEQRARRSRPPTPSKVAFAQLWPITFNGTVANKWLHECQQNNCAVKNQWHTKATVKPHRWGECHYIPPPHRRVNSGCRALHDTGFYDCRLRPHLRTENFKQKYSLHKVRMPGYVIKERYNCQLFNLHASHCT